MGQKVHPLAFRLGVSQEHSSHWFAKNQQYSQLVIEDHFLRQYIYSKFPNAGISSIHIKRQLDTIQLDISSSRIRQLLASFNKEKELYNGINELRDQMKAQLKAYRASAAMSTTRSQKETHSSAAQHVKATTDTEDEKRGDTSEKNTSLSSPIHATNSVANISLNLTKLSDPDSSAACLAEFIVEQLERRVPFRRALKQAVQRAERASVKGIKVQISGRLNGAEIARSERIHKGQVPLHTLRAKMEYTFRTARTIYGLLGVKVWIFKGFI